jgi:ABC-type sugar transport system ATPase subunit
MSDELAIEATGLKKSFGDVRVLGGAHLSVARGAVLAPPGPNGAGKPKPGQRHFSWPPRGWALARA